MSDKRFLKLLLTPRDLGRVDNFKGLKRLGHQTNTDIYLSGRGDYYPHGNLFRKVVLVSGKPDNLRAAFRALRASVGSGPLSFVVPHSSCGKIMGPGGENINRLRAETGAFIKVESGLGRAPFGETQITAKGTEDALDQIVCHLLNLQEEDATDFQRISFQNYQGRNMTLPAEIFVMVAPEQMPLIMGKGGQTVTGLQSQFCVTIDEDKENAGAGGQLILRIAGAFGDVHACHHWLLQRFTNRE